MAEGLQRCIRRGTKANAIIDVGAASGSWSLTAAEYWPGVNFILFEPLEERKAELERLCAARDNFYFVPAAAGSEKSRINFNVSGDLDGSGVADAGKSTADTRIVEVVRIDDEMQSLKLKGPFIIKLDTHGFEVPILEGAMETLKDTVLLIIEVYGFKITGSCLLFHELSGYLDKLGFRLIDMVDIMRREKDDAFWQADALYIPKTHSVFKDNSYT